MSLDVLDRDYEDLIEEIRDLKATLIETRALLDMREMQLTVACKAASEITETNEALRQALKAFSSQGSGIN